MIKLVSIILPTYNEAGNIVDLIKEVERIVKYKKEIIVVDDNSEDGTADCVKKYINGRNDDRGIRVEVRRQDRGLTNSIQKGINLSKGEVIVLLDADFSHPPVIINQLLGKIEQGFDIAVASRFVKGGGFKKATTGKKDSPVAIVLSRLMNYSIQLTLGRHFKDYTSGFIAVRRIVFDKVKLRGDYGEYFIDLIYKSHALLFKIVEIPFINLPRKKGESKTGQNLYQYLKRGSKYMLLTLRLLIEKHLLHQIP